MSPRRYHKPVGEAGGRPAAKGEAEMMHDAIEPTRAPPIGGGQVRSEPLGEDPDPAIRADAAESADADCDDDTPAGNRQVRQCTRVAAMDPRRRLIAARAPSRRGDWSGSDGQAGTGLDVIDDEAAWNDGTRMQAARHGRISNGRSRDPSTRLHRN